MTYVLIWCADLWFEGRDDEFAICEEEGKAIHHYSNNHAAESTQF